MRVIEAALKQVKELLGKMLFFRSFMNSLIIFLAFSLVFIFFSMSWLFAFIPFAIYLGFSAYNSLRKASLRDVEEKVPELRWQLRTAADNINRDDEIVRELNEDVVKKIKLVRASYFLDTKATSLKMATVLCLSLMIVLVSILNIRFEDFSAYIRDSEVVGSFAKSIKQRISFSGDTEGKADDEGIYGDESELLQYGKQQTIELDQISGLVDISKYDKDKKGKEFQGKRGFPDSSEAQQAGTFDENIKEEYREIVERYYDSINQKDGDE